MSSYAAEMIRRFREAEPTSRAERANKKESGEIQEAWWIEQENNSGLRNSTDSSINLNRTTESTIRKDLQEMVGRRSMDSTATGGGGLNNSLDALIAADIAELEKGIPNNMKGLHAGTTSTFDINLQSQSHDNFNYNNNFSNNLNTSASMGIGSIGDRLEQPTYRYDGAGTREPLADMRTSGDFFRASVETLGSTGIRGLLMPDLALASNDHDDDQNKENENNYNSNNYLPPAPKSNLEDIVKELEAAGVALNGDKRNNTPSSIDAISNQLESELQALLAPLKARRESEEADTKEQQKRDEEMKEAGRRLERERILMGDHGTTSDSSRGPLDYAHAPLLPVRTNGQDLSGVTFNSVLQSQPVIDTIAEEGLNLNANATQIPSLASLAEAAAPAVPAATTTSSSISDGSIPFLSTASSSNVNMIPNYPNNNVNRDVNAEKNIIGTGMTADPQTFANRLADQEVAMSDALFQRMRGLKNELSQRTRALDVVYASALNGQTPPARSLEILSQLNNSRLRGGDMIDGNNSRNDYNGGSSGVAGNTSKPFNPYSEFTSKNILGAAEGITSMLDVAMNTLSIRLGGLPEIITATNGGGSSSGGIDTDLNILSEKEGLGSDETATTTVAVNISSSSSSSSTPTKDAATDTMVDTANVVAKEAIHQQEQQTGPVIGTTNSGATTTTTTTTSSSSDPVSSEAASIVSTAMHKASMKLGIDLSSSSNNNNTNNINNIATSQPSTTPTFAPVSASAVSFRTSVPVVTPSVTSTSSAPPSPVKQAISTRTPGPSSTTTSSSKRATAVVETTNQTGVTSDKQMLADIDKQLSSLAADKDVGFFTSPVTGSSSSSSSSIPIPPPVSQQQGYNGYAQRGMYRFSPLANESSSSSSSRNNSTSIHNFTPYSLSNTNAYRAYTDNIMKNGVSGGSGIVGSAPPSAYNPAVGSAPPSAYNPAVGNNTSNDVERLARMPINEYVRLSNNNNNKSAVPVVDFIIPSSSASNNSNSGVYPRQLPSYAPMHETPSVPVRAPSSSTPMGIRRRPLEGRALQQLHSATSDPNNANTNFNASDISSQQQQQQSFTSSVPLVPSPSLSHLSSFQSMNVPAPPTTTTTGTSSGSDNGAHAQSMYDRKMYLNQMKNMRNYLAAY